MQNNYIIINCFLYDAASCWLKRSKKPIQNEKINNIGIANKQIIMHAYAHKADGVKAFNIHFDAS